ncbi:MAG TPA: hypothetical protein VG318_01385 [Actinomycetota bacterium]|nr:hypothetical protein [Actinomycetota bacterium]
MLHVHLGPSPLALGLLIPATSSAGFDIAIFGRAGAAEPREYLIGWSGPGGSVAVQRGIRWFEGPESIDDVPDELVDRIGSGEPLLVTATLRGAIAKRADLIESLLGCRTGGSDTILLACENDPKSEYGRLADLATAIGGQSLRTVVNRMCIKRSRDSDGRRRVSAHPLGEWLIERPARSSSVITALASAADVEIVDDIDARRDRKIWMVNGAHQALALMARRGGKRHLQTAAREPEVLARLSHIHAAMNEALRHRHPGLDGNLEYGLRHVTAYCEHPDSVKRVLGAFQRADLSTFFGNLNERVAEPARICYREGWSVEPLKFPFDVLERLVVTVDRFEDGREIRRGRVKLRAAHDDRALDAYESLLTGWMDDVEIGRRLRTLETRLSDHRRAWPA